MNDTKIDGGYAFPSPVYEEHDGMTLRQYFAAAALTGLLANPSRTGELHGLARAASESVAYADALIAELRKPSS